MKIRKIFLLSLLILLLLGVSYATEANNDTITTADIPEEVVKDASTTTNTVDTSVNKETTYKEIAKQNIENEITKTTSTTTYNVNDFDSLQSALTSDEDSVTINIKSNIQLSGDTELNEYIETLTINGNGKTIDGDSSYQFLQINSNALININNIKITNCYSSYGAAFEKNEGTMIIKNSVFSNNKVSSCGGAIDNYRGDLTIINSTFNDNSADEDGGAIRNNEYLNITRSTFNNNYANNGQTLYSSDTIYISNSEINDASENIEDSIYCESNAFIYNTTINNELIKNTDINEEENYDDCDDEELDDNIITEKTYDIANFNALQTALNNNTYNTVYINLNSNIILSSKPELNSAIKRLTINGNGKTINLNSNEFLRINERTSVLINNTIIENCLEGPAINNEGVLTIINSTLKNNKGGAIYNTGDLTIINSTLNNNTAEKGGAIRSSSTKLNITNSTFNNNYAEYGGAIELSDEEICGTDYIIINNNTFTQNKADYGSIIYSNIDQLEFNNNLLKNNKIGDNPIETSTSTVLIGENGVFEIDELIEELIAYYNAGFLTFDYQMASMINNYIDRKNSFIDDNPTYIVQETTTYTYTSHLIEIKEGNLNSKDNLVYYNNTYEIINNDLKEAFAKNNTLIQYKEATILTVGSSEIVSIGKQMSIYGKLTDDKGKNLANQSVTIKVDGKTYTTNTTQYGNYNIKITPTTTGTKTISAKYAGSNAYLNSSASSTFVAKEGTIITVGSSKTVLVGNQMSVYGKLTDNEGNNLAYHKLTVSVDGKTYTVNTTQYGNYNIKITPTTTGTKTISAKYAGSNVYLNSSASSSFVVKQGTILTVGSSATVNVGKQMSIYGKLTDKDGKNLANQQVKITVDGKTYSTNTTQYGNYNIKITPTTAGTKTIKATYAGSNIYMNSTATSTFIVKQSTIITVGSSKTVPVGSQMSVYGKLTDKDGKNLANQQVKITVDGKTITTNTTQYGNYNIKITPTTAGTKTITATYPGTDLYMNSTATSTFTAKQSTIITVGSTATVTVGKQMSIYGKLTDKDGKNLANQQIKITVDGKTYTTNTTQYGNYNIKITPTTAGTKTITATYAGNNANLASTNSTTFQVKASS